MGLKQAGEFHTATNVEGHFKTEDAVETPADVGEGLDESGFFRPTGWKSFS